MVTQDLRKLEYGNKSKDMNQSTFIFKLDSYDEPIYTDVFFPTSNNVNRHAPAAIVIAIHGGGFVLGSKDMLSRQQIQYLVQLGLVVVAPNYRLCPNLSLYDGPLKDVRDCYTWAQTDLPKLLGGEVNIDPAKIMTLGFSAGATLALLLTSMPTTPCAVAAFYGAFYFRDPSWHLPLTELSKFPSFDPDFLSMVHQEKEPSSALINLEKPDLSNPRVAWFFNALKTGNHISSIVKDGDYDRVDPACLFSERFPPTVFVHGTADTLIQPRFSVDAHAALEKLGVETELVLVENMNHAFDETVTKGAVGWEDIRKGLDFLASHAKDTVPT